MQSNKKYNILIVLIILSPILAAVLAGYKIPIDTGPDNFLVPLGVFIGIPFIAIFGLAVSSLTLKLRKNKMYALIAYSAAAIFVCAQMLFGIMLV
ncbi:MAG TPA: hypothetical protein VLF88_03125 [Candidatus Babeliales bacterium]|nr:hypothetical protein [Candidatus Babeliales bacterium]